MILSDKEFEIQLEYLARAHSESRDWVFVIKKIKASHAAQNNRIAELELALENVVKIADYKAWGFTASDYIEQAKKQIEKEHGL